MSCGSPMSRGEQIAKPAEWDAHAAGFAFPVSCCSQRRKSPMAAVLITGTSSGIGMATALAFGRAGHTVAATMRSPDPAPELARIAMQEILPNTTSKFALEALSESLAQEVKPFNVRVAIVEPGIIDTAMARRVESAHTRSPYPQERRFAAMFNASLKNPVPPSVVGEKVLEIVDSGTWQLRHPVGPDAVPFLQWRKAMSVEEWVAWGALGDDAWYDRLKADFGMDARPNA